MRSSCMPYYIRRSGVFLARTLVYSLVTTIFLPFTAVAQSSVNLAWDASDDTTVTGYNVHYGTSSGSYQNVLDAGANTVATVSNIPAGTTYFAETAYNADGLESQFSNEVAFTANQ